MPNLTLLRTNIIQRIRSRLFENATPQEFGIVVSSEEYRPGIEIVRDGKPPSLGTLTYDINSERRLRLTVRHDEHDRFTVHIMMYNERMGAWQTRMAFGCKARELGKEVRRAVWTAVEE